MATAPAPTQPNNVKPGLRKPVFTKVDQLRPGTNGHTLVVKVLDSTTVLQKGRSQSQHLRQTRIAECLIGDDTGTIIFTARNDQGTPFSITISQCIYSFSFVYMDMHCQGFSLEMEICCKVRFFFSVCVLWVSKIRAM